MQLNQREKIAVGIAGSALLLFAVLQFLVFPLMDKRTRLVKGLAVKEKAIREMRSMQERFRALSSQSGSIAETLARREEGFSLFSFLEQSADDSAVKDQIAHMRPSESPEGELFQQSRVEMKLQAVSLRQLVEFVETVESPEHLVGIDKITIQENGKEQGTLDATLQLVSIDKVAGATAQ